jgi:hypothetical protein
MDAINFFIRFLIMFNNNNKKWAHYFLD